MRQVRVLYYKRFIPTMSAYVLLVLGVTWIFHHHPVHGIWAYVLAALPALPILALFVVFGLYFKEETDELEKAVKIQGMTWGVALTFGMTTVWGFLESFVHAPRLPAFDVFPLFCLCAGVAMNFVRRRYQ